MEAKSLIKGEDFRMASLEEKAGDSSILEKRMYPDLSEECILRQEGE